MLEKKLLSSWAAKCVGSVVNGHEKTSNVQ